MSCSHPRGPFRVLPEVAGESVPAGFEAGDALLKAAGLVRKGRSNLVAKIKLRAIVEHATQQRADRVEVQAGVA